MRIRTQHASRCCAALLAVILSAPAAAAGDGMVRLESRHDVATTTQRLVDALESAGMTVFRVVDHAAGAEKAGLELPPTRVVIFGNPAVGTPLMQCAPGVAIDLPQKVLIRRDGDTTWLAYNDPQYLARRHSIEGCDEALSKVAGALARFAHQAAEAE